MPFAIVPLEVVHKDNGLTDLEIRLVCVLLSFRGKNTNVVWPSRASISERSGYAVGTISNVLKRLEQKGWLIRQKRVGVSRYEIVIPDLEVHRSSDNHRISDYHQFSEDHSHQIGEVHSHRISEDHSHRSSEMEQTKEVTKEQTNGTDQVAAHAKAPPTPAKSAAVWQAYRDAYRDRYGVAPIRDARTNKQLCLFVDRVGQDDAPGIATFFLTHNHQYYLQRGHDVSLLVQDAQKLRTEWLTGNRITAKGARTRDAHEEQIAVVNRVLAKMRAGS